MLASVSVDIDLYDLAAIATAAGQYDVHKTWYNGSVLFVEGVTQESLDTAMVNAEQKSADYDLNTHKDIARDQIDQVAEMVRLKYITGGAGQAMAYQEKGEEAADYVAANYPADLSGYPWMQAEVNATGKTASQAADDILAQKAAWISIGAQIEQQRLYGKEEVSNATTVNDVITAKDTAVAALELI